VRDQEDGLAKEEKLHVEGGSVDVYI